MNRGRVNADLDRHFKNKDGVIDKAAPVDYYARRTQSDPPGARIPRCARVALYPARWLCTYRRIKSGTLNLKHSYKYRR